MEDDDGNVVNGEENLGGPPGILGPTVHEPETGMEMTAELCYHCSRLNFGSSLEHAQGMIESKVELLQINPSSNCPLCKFFGNAIMVDPSVNDERQNTFQISIKAERRHYSFPARFQPYLLEVSTRQHEPSHLILPLRDGKIDAQPTPPYHISRPDCVDYDMLGKWLAHCENLHGDLCMLRRGENDKWLRKNLFDLRMIDCRNGNIVRGSYEEPYIALSYVWGDYGTQIKTESRLSQQRKFPRTIEDSMNVAIALGFRYLWVDKYCIDQSDEHGLQIHLHGMNDIYRNASLTIIAAAGHHADYGLPGVRPESRAPQPRLVIEGTTYTSVHHDILSSIRESRWNKRAWTYQECLFSRRRLIFSPERVVFQCNGACFDELSPSELGLVPGPGNSLTEGLLKLDKHCIPNPINNWNVFRHIDEYSSRELSYQSDVLNAIQGLLSSFMNSDACGDRDVPPFRHLWGIPTSFETYMKDDYPAYAGLHVSECADLSEDQRTYAALSYGLAWRSFQPRRSNRRKGFPSWSWTGWIQKVYWPKLSLDQSDLAQSMSLRSKDGRFEVLTKSLIDNIIGAKSDEASLHTYQLAIETTIVSLNLTYHQDEGIFRVIAGSHRLIQSNTTEIEAVFVWRAYINPFYEENDDLFRELCAETFECAIMFGHYGILLRTKQDDVTERIGIVMLDSDKFILRDSLRERNPSVFDFDWLCKEKASHDDYCLAKRFPTRQGTVVIG